MKMKGEQQLVQTSEETNQNTLKIDTYLHFKMKCVCFL